MTLEQAIHIDPLAQVGSEIRIPKGTESLGRISEAIAVAFQEGEGIALALHDSGRLRFTRWPACSACDTPAATCTPALFSFNNPRGACAACNGFGAVLEYDESLIVPDPECSLADGAIDPWTKPRYESRRRILLDFARGLGADVNKPWCKLRAAHRRELLYGRKGRYVGIFPFLKDLEEKRYKQYIRVFLRQYQLAKTCGECGGTRLNPDALAVRIGGETIAQVAARPVDGIHEWLGAIQLTAFEREVAHLILDQLESRLEFLRDVQYPYIVPRIKRIEVALKSWSERSEENARRAKDTLFSFQNARKVYDGRQSGLYSAAIMQGSGYRYPAACISNSSA